MRRVISSPRTLYGVLSVSQEEPSSLPTFSDLQVAEEEMEVDREWVSYLSKRMYDAVMSRIPDVTLNGDHDKRYPGNLNFSFAYVEVSQEHSWVPSLRWKRGNQEQRQLRRVLKLGLLFPVSRRLCLASPLLCRSRARWRRFRFRELRQLRSRIARTRTSPSE